ncbi:UNKNOWN [Stylonychia lemnae]|uniref:Uncharacterized protein n=1 Tax=Stylonychia lemnae TaxID=5949 RepID=A0A077ZRY4_STYLE|nr:UNKNOWN [Stylonychia lemnae]|eukprot:CDW72668.1 UNKNOWN [Stylonychia lemnae]
MDNEREQRREKVYIISSEGQNNELDFDSVLNIDDKGLSNESDFKSIDLNEPNFNETHTKYQAKEIMN